MSIYSPPHFTPFQKKDAGIVKAMLSILRQAKKQPSIMVILEHTILAWKIFCNSHISLSKISCAVIKTDSGMCLCFLKLIVLNGAVICLCFLCRWNWKIETLEICTLNNLTLDMLIKLYKLQMKKVLRGVNMVTFYVE